jgi:hypothetical protein
MTEQFAQTPVPAEKGNIHRVCWDSLNERAGEIVDLAREHRWR